MNESTSIIGKKYLPSDNSYSVNVTSSTLFPYKSKQIYLAGIVNEEGKECTILTDPFDCSIIHSVNKSVVLLPMIIVQYGNTTACVMYYKHCVID